MKYLVGAIVLRHHASHKLGVKEKCLIISPCRMLMLLLPVVI